MRYAPTYKEFTQGRTYKHPVLGPYAWRRDRAEDDPTWDAASWTSGSKGARA